MSIVVEGGYVQSMLRRYNASNEHFSWALILHECLLSALRPSPLICTSDMTDMLSETEKKCVFPGTELREYLSNYAVFAGMQSLKA